MEALASIEAGCGACGLLRAGRVGQGLVRVQKVHAHHQYRTLADVAIRGQICALRGRIATESGGDVLGSSDRQRGDGQGRWRGACGDEAPAPHQIEV